MSKVDLIVVVVLAKMTLPIIGEAENKLSCKFITTNIHLKAVKAIKGKQINKDKTFMSKAQTFLMFL